MNDEENTGNSNDYDEEFILRSVAISYARSRSVNSVADSLSIPADLLEEWRKGYSAKIEVRRLKDKLVTSRHIGWFLLSFKGNTADKGKRERCPKCREKVVFDHIKTFNVQSGAGVDFRPYGNISSAGGYGASAMQVPSQRVTTEQIKQCPNCGLYTMRYVIEKLTPSGV